MPRRSLQLFACAALVVASLLDAPRGRAQPNPESEKVRLEYRGLAECPDAAEFRAAVARRLTGDWEASPGELARRVDIVVARVGDGYVATIELLDAEGRLLRRAVRGRDCGDVVNGIALVTALAIESRLEEAVDSSEPATAVASTPPAAAPPTPAPAAPSAAPAPVAAAPAAPAPLPVDVASTERAPETSASEGASTPLSGRAGLRGGVATGIAPRVAPGLGVAGMLEWGAARFGLSLLGFSSGRVTEAGVEARFELFTSRLEGCRAFALGASLSLEPCLSFEAGILSGRGYSDPPTVETGQSGRSPWLAPGGLARLVASFGQLVVELEGAARFPLRREEFYVDSESAAGANSRTRVHEVPVTSWGAAAGVGVRF